MKVDRNLLREYSQYPNEYASAKVFIYLGRLFAWFFVKTRITPNQITWIWGGLMVLSALLYSTGEYYFGILGGVLWIIAYSLDYTDGIVARYKDKRSPRGKFLDMINHLTTYPLLMFCIGYGVYVGGSASWFRPEWFKDIYYVYFGILAGISLVLFMSVMSLYEEAKAGAECKYVSGKGSVSVEGKLFKNPDLFKKIMQFNPLIFTTMMIMLLVFAILDQMGLFIVLYGLGYASTITIRIILLYKDL
jgi:phosphatidylglycerophosphate synthase